MNLSSDLPFSKMTIDQKIKLLEIGDQTRTINIYRKAISAILLLLLKAVKTHHVMEFEHICFVLAETNFPLIFLKLLVSWFPSNVVRNSTGERTIKVERPILPAGDAWLRQKEEPTELKYGVFFIVLMALLIMDSFFYFCHQRNMLQDKWRRATGPVSPSSNRSSVSTKTEEDLH